MLPAMTTATSNTNNHFVKCPALFVVLKTLQSMNQLAEQCDIRYTNTVALIPHQ